MILTVILWLLAYIGTGVLIATVLGLIDRFFNDDTKKTLSRLREGRRTQQPNVMLETKYRKETTYGFVITAFAWPIVLLVLGAVNLYKIWAYFVTDSRPY